MSPRRSNNLIELAAVLPEPAGKLILDVGCGDGALTRRLAGQGARAIGIEIDEGQLVRARAAERVGTEEYRVGKGEELPFADGSVDAVLYFNSLHHVPVEAMGPALLEALRVLAPGGRLVVVEPLAEGLYFHTLQPLEDETEIRAAALAALRAAPAGLRPEAEEVYLNPVRFKDVEQFLKAAVAPDPARAQRLPAVEAELRARFKAHAAPTDKGLEFEAPMRLNTFIRA